jgi:ribosomal-protein-alanine N-acetyltransferase
VTGPPEPSVPAVTVRPVQVDDAAALAAVLVRSRAALAPWDPVRSESYFTEAGQRRGIADALRVHAGGASYPGVVLVDGRPAGRVNLNNVVRGAFDSTDLGYWVDVEQQGRGVATAAVRAVLAVAFDELGLHRVQAGTLVHNHASRRVLAKNGFAEIGFAPRYIRIAGRWQDHVLHQRLVDDPERRPS